MFFLRQLNQCNPSLVQEELRNFKDFIEIEDLSGTWQNKQDTLVIKLKNDFQLQTILDLALVLKSLDADEIQIKKSSFGTFMRFWWD